ncbi:uncharacterized protein LOC6561217 [Drosophila grimshawi]|uniref:uncharacterized protein LOC6561217 n=1 Tax=Drosophila grimshawi TaxID=7222 RepID=UPI0013EF461B|nr:uncharacterized protein LOC6561217 [Drosophila grimshawi]
MRITLIVDGILLFWEAVVFKMTNAVCESYNKSWIVINKCRLRAINRHKTTYNFNATFLHPVRTMSLRMEVFQKANGYKPWLFNVTIDLCRFLRKPFNPFAIMVFKVFVEFTNLNHTCPYMASITL